jgi:glyoxylase-like metal-dependent hydrolase (beta-lactamase superfamily II)
MNLFRSASEIGPVELAQGLESGAQIQILDVRAPFRLETGRIELAADSRFHNITGSQMLEVRDLGQTPLDPQLPVAVVCGKGLDSKKVARHLEELGMAAQSLAGGMTAWMQMSIPRELETPPALDRLVQLDRVGKGSLGYLLVSDGKALVVDPPRDYQVYLDLARDAGASIVGVADTHVHADYISGGPQLSTELQVPYYLHPADAVYPYDGTAGKIAFEPLEEGASVQVGRCVLSVRHTPGHTEGSVSYLVDDQAALTGDFLFIESIGRPDLAGKTGEWTEQLWASLEGARRDWPGSAWIYPAHYGSDSERQVNRVVGERLQELPSRNRAFTITDHASFVAFVEGRKAAFPDAYRKIKAVNVGLLELSATEADELEIGKNECALGGHKTPIE